MDQREVELRAQSGENSQLFMESQFTTNNGGGMQMMGRFGGTDFGGHEFEHDGSVEAAMMQSSGHPGAPQKITVNLEDAVLEEQKLFQILEVSANRSRMFL